MRDPLLDAGLIAGPLFIAAFTILGGTRAGYDPIRHTVSLLADSRRGWPQRANFVVTRIVYCVASVALADCLEDAGSRLTPPLIAATGVGLVGSGMFVTDPVADFPADTATSRTQTTRGGQLHDLFALPIFLGIPAAALTPDRGAGSQPTGFARAPPLSPWAAGAA